MEPGPRVLRRGGLAPLTVNFSLGGTALPGVDYTTSATNTIRIPTGVREVWLELQPVAGANNNELTETITVTVQPGAGYSLGAATEVDLTLAN